jgi:hypothetical protein
MIRCIIVLVSLAAFLAGCARHQEQTYCLSESFLVDKHFEGGAFSRCQFLSPTHVELSIAPEDSPPINPSPWYAFRVSPLAQGELTVRLKIDHGQSRYWPKISSDGRTWKRIDQQRVALLDQGSTLEFILPADTTSLWVSAQELYTPADYYDWIQRLSALPYVDSRVIGASGEGRPLQALYSGNDSELILLLGRQHPPEVTGAFAMQWFIETLFADTSLARQFRDRYSVLAVPLVNPDGVAAGHWRHNARSVDLNRDWGIFSQPETAAVASYLETLSRLAIEPALVLDFHSTRNSLFYTQLPEESPWPVDFASEWLDRVRARAPEARFEHAPRSGSGQANAKNYFFSHYSIPSLTYELGDDEDRDEIARLTPVFAEEFMRLLLER